MNLIDKALKFATKAHGDQKRKYTGEPYINHPKSVASIVKSVNHDKYMITAALLHDVVEDTEATIEDVKAIFGGKVSSLVWWLTDQSKPSDGGRKERKEIDRNHIEKAPAKAQTIKLADLIDNTSSIVKHDENFARVYMAEKKLLLGVLIKGDKSLHKKASDIVKDYYENQTKG